jgi:hypothetical protein
VNEEQGRAVAALLESDLRTRGLDALLAKPSNIVTPPIGLTVRVCRSPRKSDA